MIHGRTGSAPTAPKADEDTATCPSQASQLSTRPLPSSFPAAVYQELYNAAGLSAEHDPSSSGAFTAVNLPEGWGIYPVSPMLVMRPVQVTSSVLQKFYESVIRHCAQRFWSQTSEPLLNRTIRLGMLLLMVVGDPKGQGLPWGILALLAQGMLERVRRGWTSTWDGVFTSPSSTRYRIMLQIDDGRGSDLENGESLPTDSDDESMAGSPNCKKRKPPGS